MKLAIVGVLAFVLSLAGTTGIVLLRHKPTAEATAPAADSAHVADSTAPDSAHGGDSAKAAAPAPDSSRVPAAPPESAKATPAESTKGTSVASSTKGTPSASAQKAGPDQAAAPTAASVAGPNSGASPTPVVGPVVPGAKPASAALQGLKAAAMPGTPVAAAHAPAPTPEEKAAFKQLGKILGNMKPAEAAKVVGFLSDGEVEGVIRQLQPKQAAALLAALPQERAGTLSRRLLVNSSIGAN